MSIKSEAREIKPLGLKKSLEELFEMHDTGILKSGGLVRDFANDVVFEITKDQATKLKIAEDTLIEEAARRYLKELD
jgi:hypothetical protein